MYSLYPFGIIGISVAASVTIEVLTWLFVYRTSTYQRLAGEIDRTSKKLEVLKSTPVPTQAKTKQSKKEKRLEENMKLSTRDLFFARFKINAIAGIFLIILYRFLTTVFDGVTVAKLPFIPPGFMWRVTHGGLQGEDGTDCAVTFIYVLCSVGVRGNIVKLLGMGPSRALQKAGSTENILKKLE